MPYLTVIDWRQTRRTAEPSSTLRVVIPETARKDNPTDQAAAIVRKSGGRNIQLQPDTKQAHAWTLVVRELVRYYLDHPSTMPAPVPGRRTLPMREIPDTPALLAAIAANSSGWQELQIDDNGPDDPLRERPIDERPREDRNEDHLQPESHDWTIAGMACSGLRPLDLLTRERKPS